MEKLILAIATDDGQNYTSEHFGDARYFDIYELTPEGYTFLRRVENTTEREHDHEEHHHGDKQKAQGIIQILKQHNVNVMVAKVFGPNIKKVNKHFACVFMDDTNIENSLKKMQEKFELLKEEWEKGENRKFLNFNKL